MKYVVFVAPFVGSTMLRCLQAFLKLKQVRLGIITQQPYERLPKIVQNALKDHYQIQNCLDQNQLSIATQAFVKEWGRVDRLIGYLEHLQLPLAQVRSQLGIHGMKADVAKRFRDKNAMKEQLRQAGLPVAKQAKIHNAEDVFEFIDRCNYPIVLKPLAGVGSKNTMRIQNEDELYAALNILMPSQTNPVQAEEFIQGEEHTMETVFIDGECVWQSSTYYLPGPLKVIENPWIQYCVLLPKEQMRPHAKQFSTQNIHALQALGLRTGLSHMEWFLREKDPPQLVSEVGARPPGVNIMPLMSLAHDVDMWDKWAELMVHETWEMPKRSFAVASAFLRAQGSGKTIQRIDGIQEIQRQLAPLIAASSLPQIGQPRSSHYEGDGWIILKHTDTKALVDALRKVITTIRITS
ncbi:MAG: hypothetical protein VX278_21305 [Myxococcota bacterium]|nr:hypothetical protein [Myxococcota bacterium]